MDGKERNHGGGQKVLSAVSFPRQFFLGSAIVDQMPVGIAGGRLRHGQHLAFDRKNNYTLPNLFVSMLQSMGIEEGSFASSTGTMRGLELV